MDAPEQWITVEDIAAARERLTRAIPQWEPPAAHGVALLADYEEIAAAHFPLVNTGDHQLPAAVLATVVGYSGGSAAYALTRSQLEHAIALLAPAEACRAYEHPNLWRWRDAILPAWRRDPSVRVFAAFLGSEGAAATDDPAVRALRAAVDGR